LQDHYTNLLDASFSEGTNKIQKTSKTTQVMVLKLKKWLWEISEKI
jgi:hypothetical protein